MTTEGLIAQIILQVGGLGVLAMIVWRFVDKIEPRLTAFLTALSSALARIETKLDAIPSAHEKAIQTAAERIARELDSSASGTRAAVREHATATGQHTAQAAEQAALIALARASAVDPDEAVPQRRSPPTPMLGYGTMKTLPRPPPSTRAAAVVLIVEDDRPSAKALQLLLRVELHVEAAVAHSCREAHELLRPPAVRPKVAIIDYHLGTNDEGHHEYGVDLANELPRGIAIILVSGAIDRAGLERVAKGVNVSAWFEKPIDFGGLIAKVKEIIEA